MSLRKRLCNCLLGVSVPSSIEVDEFEDFNGCGLGLPQPPRCGRKTLFRHEKRAKKEKIYQQRLQIAMKKTQALKMHLAG